MSIQPAMYDAMTTIHNPPTAEEELALSRRPEKDVKPARTYQHKRGRSDHRRCPTA